MCTDWKGADKEEEEEREKVRIVRHYCRLHCISLIRLVKKDNDLLSQSLQHLFFFFQSVDRIPIGDDGPTTGSPLISLAEAIAPP